MQIVPTDDSVSNSEPEASVDIATLDSIIIQVEQIVNAGLFGKLYYLAAYPDVAASGEGAVEHFARQGWREERNPNRYFDTAWYLEQLPAEERGAVNPLLHYVQVGEPQGLRPIWYFDPSWYRRRYSLGEGESPLRHFLENARSGRVSPVEEFNVEYYLEHNPEVLQTDLDPFAHYLEIGFREGRDPSAYFPSRRYMDYYLDGSDAENPLLHYLRQNPRPYLAAIFPDRYETESPQTGPDEVELVRATCLVDEAFYLAAFPDVAALGAGAVEHFARQGWREERNPNRYFDKAWYLEQMPAEERGAVNPLLHYVQVGEPQGLRPSSYFDPSWYRRRHSLAEGESPLRHFLENARSGRVSPIKEFDVRYYLEHNPDVLGTDLDPFAHYLETGFREGRDPSANFPSRRYMDYYLDGSDSENPLLHYLRQNPRPDLAEITPERSEMGSAQADPSQSAIFGKTGTADQHFYPAVNATSRKGSKFDCSVQNFDGSELFGWVTSETDELPNIWVEIDGLGRAEITEFHERNTTSRLENKQTLEFRVAVTDLFPDLVEYGKQAMGVPYRVAVTASHGKNGEAPVFSFEGSWDLIERTVTVTAQPTIDGRIDTLDERWISGWTLPDTSGTQTIELVEGSSILATAVSGIYRADVEKRYPEGRYSGFIMATPRTLSDGFSHQVIARTKSGWIFPGFPKTIRLGNIVGLVEKITRDSVEGWFGFRQVSDVSPKMLTILCNGNVIGTTNLHARRPDVVEAGIAEAVFSYSFRTRRGIYSEDLVTVVDASTGYSLRINPTARAANLPSAVVGHLDLLNEFEILGWAMDRRTPGDAVRIVAYQDGEPVAETITGSFRADVQRTFPLALRPGFTISTPISLRDGQPHQLELRASGTTAALSGSPRTVRFPARTKIFRASQREELSLLTSIVKQKKQEAGTERLAVCNGVAHIILNRNGGGVFVRCLESLLQTFDFGRDEIIVVDHNSNDVSRDALALIEEARLAKVVWKVRNESFSKSNNDAAALASAPVLLFLNNDIEFVAPLSRRIEEHLRATDVGAVGIKLYDIVEPSAEAVIAREVKSLRIQHLGVWFLPGPKNTNYNMLGYDITSAASHGEIFGVHEVAVVTGAVLGVRATDFQAIGGFDPVYFYGIEDIDLCLRIRQRGLRVICDRNAEALHVRGYTRFTHRGGDVSTRFEKNNKHLWSKFGPQLRRDYRRSILARDGIFGPPTFRVGFAVTEAGTYTVAGDYFTALELAQSLAEHRGMEYVFLSERDDWYDCSGLDALIVMRHDYDLGQVRNQKAQCIFIGWARNHFDSWLDQRWIDRFDVMLSSSKLFAQLLRRRSGISPHLMYIATSFQERPEPAPPIEQDVTFVGSRWGGTREIETALFPDLIEGQVRVFGAGLDEVSQFRDHWGGVVPYAEVESIYHRSRIVVDDANATTKRWGSPNSRVFDAIASGAVVLTNSRATSIVLESTLPIWSDRASLSTQINDLLGDPDKFGKVAGAQACVVRAHHSYAERAGLLLSILGEHVIKCLRIDILTAVPSSADENLWGDWHFAQGLARAFRRHGHAVRVRKLGDKVDRSTDVVIGLRGLQKFDAVLGAINILWIISHPDLVAGDELRDWHHVFVPSKIMVSTLRLYNESISVLEQATELTPASLWAQRRNGDKMKSGVFVGNSRGVHRPFIESAAEAGLEFRVWGEGWTGTVLEDHVIATSIPNAALGKVYSDAAFILSDHWPDMAQQGIVANRVFDGLAAGGVVITDAVEGIDDLDLPNLFVCRTTEELMIAVARAQMIGEEERLVGGNIVATRFSFKNRAEIIEKEVFRLLGSGV